MHDRRQGDTTATRHVAADRSLFQGDRSADVSRHLCNYRDMAVWWIPLLSLLQRWHRPPREVLGPLGYPRNFSLTAGMSRASHCRHAGSFFLPHSLINQSSLAVGGQIPLQRNVLAVTAIHWKSARGARRCERAVCRAPSRCAAVEVPFKRQKRRISATHGGLNWIRPGQSHHFLPRR